MGSSLVPVYSFGENDIFAIHEFEENSRMQKLQKWAQKKMGVAMPIVYGRSLTGGLLNKIFGITVGLLPFRVPIHSVCGKPIECPKMA